MLHDRIDFAVANRIHPEIYFSGDDLDASHEKDLRGLAAALQENGLEATVHGPFMDLSPGGTDRRVKEITFDRFFKTLLWAHLFKAKAVVFHAGYERLKFDGDVKAWLQSSLQTWRPLVKEAEERALILVIENVFEEDPDPLAALFHEIDSPHFRFCFDTGHHNLISKTPLSLWIESLGRHLFEVHLHDNHKEWDEHLPMGDGNFDFHRFFGLLSSHHLNPIYTIEPHREEHLRRGLEAAKRYIVPLVS